jgi:hypothetical protein
MATAVEYDAKSGHVLLRLINDNATSIADGQTVKLRIVFTTGNRLDDGWGEQDFTIFVSNGTRVLNSGWFNTEMLDDFAKNDYFIAEFGEKLVSGAKLTDSAAMIAKLRKCSVEAAGLNPKDPFVP